MNNGCKKFHRTLLGSIFVFLLSFSISCASPCVQLAKKICDCEENADIAQQCKDEVDLRVRVLKQHADVPPPDDARCSEILASQECDCLKIKQNKVEECMLTRSGKNR